SRTVLGLRPIELPHSHLGIGLSQGRHHGHDGETEADGGRGERPVERCHGASPLLSLPGAPARTGERPERRSVPKCLSGWRHYKRFAPGRAADGTSVTRTAPSRRKDDVRRGGGSRDCPATPSRSPPRGPWGTGRLPRRDGTAVASDGLRHPLHETGAGESLPPYIEGRPRSAR